MDSSVAHKIVVFLTPLISVREILFALNVKIILICISNKLSDEACNFSGYLSIDNNV